MRPSWSDATAGTVVASRDGVTLDLPVLKCGNCEELKLGVHAGALALAALCCAYNAAAWLVRREPHLAANTVLYAMLIAWEQQHVSRHMEAIRHPSDAVPSVAASEVSPPTPLAA
jgi:hypothetical protein